MSGELGRQLVSFCFSHTADQYVKASLCSSLDPPPPAEKFLQDILTFDSVSFVRHLLFYLLLMEQI